MESIFPDILFLGPYFGPMILRTAVAVYFLLYAYSFFRQKTMRSRMLAFNEAVIGILLMLGILTQLVTLVGIFALVMRKVVLGAQAPKQGWAETILVIGVLLALVITGAGFSPFPFSDLPY